MPNVHYKVSDPLLSSMILNKNRKPKAKEYCPETIKLLLPADPHQDHNTTETSEAEE